MRRFPLAALVGLGLCLLLCGVASCGDGFNLLMGTPMPNEQNCKYVPDVEYCTSTADNITDTCLHDCVMKLCTTAKIVCDETTVASCAETSPGGGAKTGFVNPHGQTCQNPWNEINWCQRSISPSCQANHMVHELSHACGWHHNDGFGVPGNDGGISCN